MLKGSQMGLYSQWVPPIDDKFSGLFVPAPPPILDTNKQVRNLEENKVSLKKPKSCKSLDIKAKKLMSQKRVASALLDYGNDINSPNIPEYIAFLQCGTILSQTDNKYLSQVNYCNSRLCSICSGVRSMKVQERLLPKFIELSKSVQLGTLVLTSSNLDIQLNSIDSLKNKIDNYNKVLIKIKDRLRKKGLPFDCINSLEVIPEGYKQDKTGNKGRYYAAAHPHFHFIGPYDVLKNIRSLWIDMVEGASPRNQKLIIVTDINKSIKEVIKYTIKPFHYVGLNCVINVQGVENVVSALKRKRRIKCCGVFYDFDKEIKKIEKLSIKELDIEKQEYNDLPVKDKGELIEAFGNMPGANVFYPSFSRVVEYVWCNKKFDWYFLDNGGLDIVWLVDRDKPPDCKKIKVMIGKEYCKRKNYD